MRTQQVQRLYGFPGCARARGGWRALTPAAAGNRPGRPSCPVRLLRTRAATWEPGRRPGGGERDRCYMKEPLIDV
jgi:hypothetical protein